MIRSIVFLACIPGGIFWIVYVMAVQQRKLPRLERKLRKILYSQLEGNP